MLNVGAFKYHTGQGLFIILDHGRIRRRRRTSLLRPRQVSQRSQTLRRQNQGEDTTDGIRR
jgi:hypothetical protein